jgi:phosphoribosylaminoimidazole (AIR) synthetase
MGMVLIIDPPSLDELSDHLSSLNEEFTVIGKVV